VSTLNISLPRFDYMCQNNTFSGSQGRFRYKFFPEKKDDIDTVLVAACYFDNCYEVEEEAGRVTRQEFACSDEGIDAAESWIRAQYDETQK
jgi:hypothetical protein